MLSCAAIRSHGCISGIVVKQESKSRSQGHIHSTGEHARVQRGVYYVLQYMWNKELPLAMSHDRSRCSVSRTSRCQKLSEYIPVNHLSSGQWAKSRVGVERGAIAIISNVHQLTYQLPINNWSKLPIKVSILHHSWPLICNWIQRSTYETQTRNATDCVIFKAIDWEIFTSPYNLGFHIHLWYCIDTQLYILEFACLHTWYLSLQSLLLISLPQNVVV